MKVNGTDGEAVWKHLRRRRRRCAYFMPQDKETKTHEAAKPAWLSIAVQSR